MIFESLWPLLFLAAVPVIIILYLLKPRGEDYQMSSNLLWQKLLKNQQSKTFFEKFIHNILMYLQILIVALLMIALMSPFIRTQGISGGRKILLLDTSGSMQHVGASGKSRLEEAIEQASDYIRSTENTRFSIVSVDATGVKLLAVDMSDASSLVQTLKGLKCSDGGGNLQSAQGLLDTLVGEESENIADLLVYTDGEGADDFNHLQYAAEKSLYVIGQPVGNVANDYTVFTQREDGLYDIIVSVTNYSNTDVSLDIGLYENEDNLIALQQARLSAEENKICLFEKVDWKGQTLKSSLSGISFAEGGKDSLETDNASYTVKTKGDLIQGLLVGEGNTFIEKAYEAVTGSGVTKATTDTALSVSDGATEEDSYNVVIYDAGQVPMVETGNRLIFGKEGGTVSEELQNVVLDMTECDLTAGLSGFHIGVNTAYSFTLPEGAKSFLEYHDKCVGYYREVNGRKEVVVGFDVRESDFPLRAEFPVFLANAMIYLSDTSWLATNTYYAGEELALQPWAEIEKTGLPDVLSKAGIYQIGNEEYQEEYVVRFQTATESDGRKAAESIGSSGEVQLQMVKQTLRNFFLIAVLVLLIAEWIIYIRQMRYKGKFYLVLRGIVFLCVLLALLGIQVRLGGSKTATIFVVDFSNSNEENISQIEQYIGDKVAEMPSGNSYAVVTFGKDMLVEQFMTTEKYYGGLMTLPDKTATNFEEAISKAMTLIPAEASGRLVVLTDGKETRGDVQRMAQALTAGKIEFLTLLYDDVVTTDAYVNNVTLPAYLHPGDKYSINVQVESNYDTDAVIAIYNGSSQMSSNKVRLNKGSNQFVFSAQISTDADSNVLENIRVQVQAENDTCGENDFYSAYSVVEAMPKILVITGKDAKASAFTNVLNAAGCDYSVVSALNAPDTIQEMLGYKSMVLVDTYIDDLPRGFLGNLESYIKDYGCGLICTGGEDSYALGGYRDTVLETVLPVDMDLRNVNEKPSMAMLMVIDHSGSMSGSAGNGSASNLDIAIKAATVAVDNLRDSDYVGVLTFDSEYTWQVELVQASDRQAIKDKIKHIAEGGGTTIKPALEEAYRAISGCEAAVKHVVLLTDGQGETTDYSDVIKNYTDGGVTLSTVAVGDGSDTKLLDHLARKCNGRYYYSDISTDIPKIFAQEVFLGGDSYLQNGDFNLVVRSSHELTANLFADGWPMIKGYVSSSPKTASSSIITSYEKDDPILTVWQYGLGRTVAWNSDVSGEWSGTFSGKEDYVQLWKRIVDYSTGNADMGEDRVDVVTAGEMTEIVYETKEYGSATAIMATVIDPEGNTREVKLQATAPGKYKVELPTSQTGMYHFNIRRMEGEQIQSYMTTAATVQFSDEYKFDVSNASYLSFVEQCGKVITKEEDIWTDISDNAKGKRNLTNWLLGLAIGIFLVDIAVRRFQYVPNWKWRNKKPVVETIAPIENVVAVDEAKATVEPDKKMTVKKTKATPKKKKPEEQTLDTSQLLKKKDDRNI